MADLGMSRATDLEILDVPIVTTGESDTREVVLTPMLYMAIDEVVGTEPISDHTAATATELGNY
jgi:hypothetical protein